MDSAAHYEADHDANLYQHCLLANVANLAQSRPIRRSAYRSVSVVLVPNTVVTAPRKPSLRTIAFKSSLKSTTRPTGYANRSTVLLICFSTHCLDCNISCLARWSGKRDNIGCVTV